MPSQDDYYYEPGEEYFPEGMYREALAEERGRTGESRNRERDDALYDRAMKERGPVFEELYRRVSDMYKKIGFESTPSLRDYVVDAIKYTQRDPGVEPFIEDIIMSLQKGQTNWEGFVQDSLGEAGQALGEANMPMSPPPPAPPEESDPYRPDYTFNTATGEHVTRNPRRTYVEPNYDYRKPLKPDIRRMSGTFPSPGGLLKER